MAGLAVLAVSAGRVAPALRVLAVTVTLLLLVDPMLVHALGFRLSVAATAGLVAADATDRAPAARSALVATARWR